MLPGADALRTFWPGGRKRTGRIGASSRMRVGLLLLPLSPTATSVAARGSTH